MKISTTVVIKFKHTNTLEELGQASGSSSNAIIPRIGESVELKGAHAGAETILYKVTSVNHSYAVG